MKTEKKEKYPNYANFKAKNTIRLPVLDDRKIPIEELERIKKKDYEKNSLIYDIVAVRNFKVHSVARLNMMYNAEMERILHKYRYVNPLWLEQRVEIIKNKYKSLLPRDNIEPNSTVSLLTQDNLICPALCNLNYFSGDYKTFMRNYILTDADKEELEDLTKAYEDIV
jgi:hypothetical protein